MIDQRARSSRHDFLITRWSHWHLRRFDGSYVYAVGGLSVAITRLHYIHELLVHKRKLYPKPLTFPSSCPRSALSSSKIN